MIKTIIFDFGDVFINLDKRGALKHALELFQLEDFDHDLLQINSNYEKGHISTEEFIGFYKARFPGISEADLVSAWNFIIRDFPPYRLDFLKDLRQKSDKRFILLSNTNEMHINYVMETVSFYAEFKDQFDRFYLSHQIGMRKPEADIYKWVLEQDNLNAGECLFIDDTAENTNAAIEFGIKAWNINPDQDDIVELRSKFDL